MKNKLSWLALGGLAVALLAGVLYSCGGGGGTPPASTTTISARLYTGTIGPINRAATPDAPLAGYQLYCVTFSTPPLSAAGTSAADGSVSLTLEVGSADLGCFILDASGTSVASIIFANSDLSQTGQTVSAGGAVDFGTITVELANGVATATIPGGVTIDATTPPGAACPDGTWRFTSDIHRSACPAGTVINGTMWIAEAPGGGYVVSYMVYDDMNHDMCIAHGNSGTDLTWDGTTAATGWFLDFDQDTCPGKIVHIDMTTSGSACSTADMVVTFDGCTGPCECTTLEFTATRE
jgi:hypothetical protein